VRNIFEGDEKNSWKWIFGLKMGEIFAKYRSFHDINNIYKNFTSRASSCDSWLAVGDSIGESDATAYFYLPFTVLSRRLWVPCSLPEEATLGDSWQAWWVCVGRGCWVVHICNSLLKLGLCSFSPSKFGFVLHNLAPLKRRGGFSKRIGNMDLSKLRERSLGVPIIGRTCAFDAKKGFRRRRTKHVSCFQKGSKKNFGFLDFCFQVCAHLIEKSPLAPRAQAAGALGW
jgi:hypothetical protein